MTREQRPYLGGSTIGDDCLRKLWLGFRGFKPAPPSAKGRRIFEQGHDIETRVIQMLKAVPGVQLLERDHRTGRQFEIVTLNGHVKSHFDGLIRAPAVLDSDEWHLLEVKSMKTDGPNGFERLVEVGVAVAHPKYWSQMQFYMHSTQGSDRPLTRALFVAYNKNNSDMHFEIIEYDPRIGLMLDADASRIVESGFPPPRIRNSPGTPPCAFCEQRSNCWGFGEDHRFTSCRQCVYAAPETTGTHPPGTWLCRKEHNLHCGKPIPPQPCEQFVSVNQ